jgi:hypothetical protein
MFRSVPRTLLLAETNRYSVGNLVIRCAFVIEDRWTLHAVS